MSIKTGLFQAADNVRYNQHFDVNLISRQPSSINRQLTPATPFLWRLYTNESETCVYKQKLFCGVFHFNLS